MLYVIPRRLCNGLGQLKLKYSKLGGTRKGCEERERERERGRGEGGV